MPITINGTTGLAGVDGSAGTPAVQGADANTGIFFPAADTIAFAEGGAEVARFDSSGNFGIGTSSPNSRMSVAVSSTSTSVLSSYANIPLLLQNTSSTDNNWSVIAVQDASGDFSSYIGTQNTSQSSNTAIMAFGTNGGIGATERMRIDSSGNLLVGTTAAILATARATFSTASSAGIVSAVSSNTNLFCVNTNNTSWDAVSFRYNTSTEVGRIACTSTATSYVTSSDYRLKENQQPMVGALSIVQQLKPCTYTWKSTGEDGQGFIAHELQAVVPECVVGEKDGVDVDGNPVYQGIDTSFLVATLTAAIQEQQALIVQLQADVAALKGATA